MSDGFCTLDLFQETLRILRYHNSSVRLGFSLRALDAPLVVLLQLLNLHLEIIGEQLRQLGQTSLKFRGIPGLEGAYLLHHTFLDGCPIALRFLREYAFVSSDHFSLMHSKSSSVE